MRIIEPTETIDIKHPVMMIHGWPGIGKTSLGYTMRKPLLRDYDKGAHRAIGRQHTLVIDSYADVEASNSGDALAKFDTVVEDTVGRCLDVMTVKLIAENPKYAQGGGLTQSGWGALKSRYRQHLATLRANDKDILLIAHSTEKKDSEERIWRPDIVGGSFDEVVKSADFIGFLYLVGNKRILDFNPNQNWIAKNPGQWPPFEVPVPSDPKLPLFMAGLMDMAREALGKISDESSSVVRQVADWRERLQQLDGIDAFTAQVPVIGGLVPVLKAQVATLLLDRAKSLGYRFDKKAKAFVAADPLGVNAA